ncbi:MAG: penicillin-binding protein 2 [Bacteroidales bacterium]|nr:penicillin-binding protein 2 [Bacteroidales bacterium]
MSHFSKRKYVVGIIILTIFIAIFIKLFYIQIFDKSLKQSSDNNSQRHVVVYPGRGLIYDRNSVLLVCNEAAYDLMLVPRNMYEFDTLSLCSDINISIEDFYAKFENCKKYSIYRPSIFHKQINSTQYAVLQEHLYKYPGFFVQARTLRKYNEGVAAHILGDIGEIDLETLENDGYYSGGDYIGKSGVEKYYENILRGSKGVQIFLVDVSSNIQGPYYEGKYDKAAIPGKDIYLTIDIELQRYGELLMKNKTGSIVAIQPKTGEILALVSSPSYDPQLLVGRERGKNYDSLLNSPTRPLINRAVSSTYPPGSIFKIANALVALQDGLIKTNSYFPCDVSKIGCHGHPPANGIARAIQYSCNPYFYFVFRNIIQRGIEKSIFKDSRIGIDLWKDKIMTLGFNHSFDIGLPSVNKGLIPSAEYYDKWYGKHRWAFSTIYSLSIGQGEVLVSPLQMANFCAIIANRGFYYYPHILKKIEDEDYIGENTQKTFTPFDKEYFEEVVKGMDYAVNDDFGTGGYARLTDIRVCGKTGTAQNKGKDHSVFIAFAPKDDPQIAIAVYVENAGFGGTWAAPISRLMIEKYIRGYVNDIYLEKRIIETEILN